MNKITLIIITFLFIAVSASLILFLAGCGQNGMHFGFIGSSNCPMGDGQFHFEKWRSAFQSIIANPVLVLLIM